MADVVLAGDSHLAHIDRVGLQSLEELLPGVTVHNCAVSGLTSVDLARRAPALARLCPGAVVVSIGTNDAAPWGPVALEEYRTELRRAFVAFAAPVVFLTPPPIDETALLAEDRGRTNAGLRPYDRIARELCDELGGTWLDSAVALGTGTGLRTEDGIHLSPVAYALLIPAIATTLRASLDRVVT